jgi:hypothetical protein
MQHCIGYGCASPDFVCAHLDRHPGKYLGMAIIGIGPLRGKLGGKKSAPERT